MFRILTVFLLFSSISFSYSQEFGVQFVDKPWEEILEQAEQEQKLIFVDMFAEWCIPCKVMEEEIFTYPELGDKYNKSFISTRLNVDSLEGSMISMRYDVVSLPGLLFLTPDETLVYRLDGYQGIAELMREHDVAQNPNLKFQAWSKRYASGDRNSNFLYSYAVHSDSIQSSQTDQLYNDYLLAEKDWLTPKSSAIVLRQAEEITDSTFRFILANPEYYNDQFTEEVIQTKIYDKLEKEADRLISQSNYDGLRDLYAMAYGEEGVRLASVKEIEYFSEKGDVLKVSTLLQNYVESGYKIDEKLMQPLKNITQNSQTPEELAMAQSLYKKLIDLEPNSPELMTELVPLYVKSGNWDEAVKTSKSAYKLAKSMKVDGWRNYKKAYKSIRKQARKAS